MRHVGMLPFLVVLLALTILAPACQTVTGRSTGRFVDDQTISGQVKTRLVLDRALNLTRVGVDTVNGVVHLHGVVDTPQDRERAEQRARQVAGVVDVRNLLQVRGEGAAALPR
jgi:osmotically-inducible protein OsmY